MEFFVRITEGIGHHYGWKAVERDDSFGWRDICGGRHGSATTNYASESTENRKVPPGSIVKLHEVAGGERLFFWYSGGAVSWE